MNGWLKEDLHVVDFIPLDDISVDISCFCVMRDRGGLEMAGKLNSVPTANNKTMLRQCSPILL